jgi:thiamine-phosphate pyrophosphorylase
MVTDSKLCTRPEEEMVGEALAGGVTAIQYREKEKPAHEMVKTARELRKLTSDHDALLIINDRIDVALAVGADGVHLGQEDMPYETTRKILGEKAVIGMTAHTVEEAVEAQRKGADYIGLSPIFPTSTKTDAGPAAGVALVKDASSMVHIPKIAIGGITEENMEQVFRAGADGVAMISGVVTSQDIEGTVRRILDRIRTIRGQSLH